jgi:hypothetical protein
MKAISDRVLLWISIVCAALPPRSLVNDANLSHKIGEAVFFGVLAVLVPLLWLIATLAYYRRLRTKAAKWLFALTPLAMMYPLGALILAVAVLLKPGRW